ncbi:MAG: SDR family oxidoreductase [Candidatus Helarchaeota archaeon]|nr:SDR family oxidoreductase [Candidatus Helarchaeota archaeon]
MSTDMSGKICIVTGANAGIGKATAMELAKMGATVVMVCRSPERGGAALADIKQKSGNDSVDLMIADLSSMNSIRQFAADFKAKYKKLHVLINNAGVHLAEHILTVDGYECTFATNHLGYFLLTNLLLDVIKASAPARIINVSSEAHGLSKIYFDDLQLEKNFDGFRAYTQSKLANIMFTYELARRIEGTGVTVNCLHPGMVLTNMGRNSEDVRRVMQEAGDSILTPEEGAATSIYLATSPEVENVTGKYFDNKKAVKSSRKSYDQNSQQRLWELSEKLTGLVK